jgi:hypothetical protein
MLCCLNMNVQVGLARMRSPTAHWYFTELIECKLPAGYFSYFFVLKLVVAFNHYLFIVRVCRSSGSSKSTTCGNSWPRSGVDGRGKMHN